MYVSNLPKTAWQPLIDRVTDKLPIWKGNLLQRSGRLTLIRTTLTGVTFYLAISLGIPKWVIKALTKIMQAFLWSASDIVQGGKCLVGWDQVQRLRELRGLGIKNLNLMGMSLRARWLWFRSTYPTRPWASLPVAEDAATSAFFNASFSCKVKNGKSILFWDDPWLQG
jgi:hypothetical protein